jgi:hypothetical protein
MATGRVPTTANSPLTAKGDLFTYSTAPARLAVGNNGDTIVADSSTSTGLRYTAGTVQSNPIINSAMQVWQRGTSFTNGGGASVFGADRWQIYSSTATGRTWSRQATNDTTNLPNIQYCMRLARNSGDTQTGIVYTIQNLETVNSIPYAGKTVTFSFYARAGANFSSASNAFAVGLITGTGTDQNSLAGYTGQAYTVNTSATLTTTWQRFTFTGTIPTNTTEIGMQLGYTPTGTAGANDWAELTGVQIDIGSVALPFRTYAGTIQGELAACQRYYWRGSGSQGVNAVLGSAQASSTTAGRAYITFPVTMRTAPTSVDWSALSINEIAAGYTVSTLTLVGSGLENPNMGAVSFTTTGLNAYRYYAIVINNSSSGFLGFSAEL